MEDQEVVETSPIRWKRIILAVKLLIHFFDGLKYYYADNLCGGTSRAQTDDLLRAKQILSQLSYGPR